MCVEDIQAQVGALWWRNEAQGLHNFPTLCASYTREKPSRTNLCFVAAAVEEHAVAGGVPYNILVDVVLLSSKTQADAVLSSLPRHTLRQAGTRTMSEPAAASKPCTYCANRLEEHSRCLRLAKWPRVSLAGMAV